MNEVVITLAVEDMISEVISRNIIAHANNKLIVSQCLCKGGYGYLKSKINAFNVAAKGMPFLVLTDQDNSNTCPRQIIDEWLDGNQHPNLLLRIAVMEVESWIMAHREAFSNFLSIPINRIPYNVDEVENPKQFLVNLARRSRQLCLRNDLIPGNGSSAQVGPDYNNRLAQFIREHWNVNEARQHSSSLDRAFSRIHNFEPVWN